MASDFLKKMAAQSGGYKAPSFAHQMAAVSQQKKALQAPPAEQIASNARPFQNVPENIESDAVQFGKLQAATFGAQQPIFTQQDINKKYDELSTLQAKKATQTFDAYSGDTNEYGGLISKAQDELNSLTNFVAKDQKFKMESIPKTQEIPSKWSPLQDVVRYITDPNFKNEIQKVYDKEAEGGVLTIDTRYKGLDYITDQEKKTLFAYLNNGDTSGANKYYDLLARELNQRYDTARKKNMASIPGQDTFWGKVANAGASIGAAYHLPASYFATLAQDIKNKITGNYQNADLNSMGFAGARLSEETENAVTKDMGPVGKTIMSGVLSLSRTGATLPFGAVTAQAMSYLTAAGQTSYQAQKNGATVDQAAQIGTVSGTIEALTEKVPIEKFLKAADEGATSVIQVLKGVKNNFKPEFVQEAISEYANNLTDQYIMGSKSQLNQLIALYESQGYSKEQAARKAVVQLYVVNPFVSGVTGGVSGVVIGGGLTGLNYTPSGQTAQGKIIKSADAISEVIQQELESAPDTKSYQLASQMQGKLDANKKVSDADIGRLRQANVTTFNQPYAGKTPTSVKGAKEITINQSSLDQAREHIKDAEFAKDFAETPDAFKNKLMEIYKSSGNARQAAVDGSDGKSYNVTINKNTLGKVVSDPKVSAEKLAVLKNIDAIVKNSAYVESGKSTTKTGGKQQTVRHDYFEAPVIIGSDKYVARFDVALSKSAGGTVAQNVVSGIDVVKTPEALMHTAKDGGKSSKNMELAKENPEVYNGNKGRQAKPKQYYIKDINGDKKVYDQKADRNTLQEIPTFQGEIEAIADILGMPAERVKVLAHMQAKDIPEAEIDKHRAIRDSYENPTKETIMQKVLPASAIDKIISSGKSTFSGFMIKAADTKLLINAQDFINGLALNFPVFDENGNTVHRFPPNTQSICLIRFRTKNAKKIRIPYGEKLGGTNTEPLPCLQNGYTASQNGEIMPEYYSEKDNPVKISNGAELYEIFSDGSEVLRAVFNKKQKNGYLYTNMEGFSNEDRGIRYI